MRDVHRPGPETPGIETTSVAAVPPPTALTVAGSDPSGGAGAQADLKTFAAHGVYGMSALTLLTVGNTEGVRRVVPVAPGDVVAQFVAVVEDIPPSAVKTGMLGDVATITAVAAMLARWRAAHPLALVVDPVMRTRRGDVLLPPGAEAAVAERLVPLATVLTPNVPEAERLTGRAVRGRDDMAAAARALHAMGARHVVIKGGHFETSPVAVDCYFDGRAVRWLEAPRIATRHTHGAGCTFAAAITAGLALGWDVPASVERAKAYVAGAIAAAPGLGRGRGPLDHAWTSRRGGAAPDPAAPSSIAAHNLFITSS